jgi:outer membrane protein TolC
MIDRRNGKHVKKAIFIGLLLLMASNGLPGINQPNSYTFEQLRNLLLQNNPSIRAQQQELVRSFLDVKDARAAYWPSIDLEMSGTYMMNPPLGPITLSSEDLLSGLDWPAGFTPTATGGYINLYDGMEKTLYNFSLSLTQPLFTWGKISKSVELYETIHSVRQWEAIHHTNELTMELETRLCALYYLNATKNLLQTQLELAYRLVELVQQGADEGMLLQQDIAEARVQGQQIDLALLQVTTEYDKQKLALRSLTAIANLDVTVIEFQPDEAAFLAMLQQDPDILEQQALSPMNASLRAMNALSMASAIVEDITKASFYGKPDLALVVSAGYSGPRFPLIETDWYRQDDYSFNITIGMKTTVWDGGKKLNDIKRTASSTASAMIDEEKTRIFIIQTLREQLLAMQLAYGSIQYHDLVIRTTMDRVEQQQQLFTIGYGDESSLLKARIAENNARIEREKQRMELATAYYSIRFLTQNMK